MDLDFGAIKGLIEVSEKCDLSELLIEYEGVKIEIKRERKKDSFPLTTSHKIVEEPLKVPLIPPKEIVSFHSGKVSEEKISAEVDNDKYYKVLSPLVGVFYKAPWPGAEPFVKVGDEVAVGQTLCIVEAMKLMNEIASEVSGKIVKILAKNEEVVQCDQALFLIDPD